MNRRDNGVRVLVIPGLHDSGPAHWQTWLQQRWRGAVRVQQHDWTRPDLDAWAARIDETLARAGPGPWVAVAHSFGCLALARHLVQNAAANPVQAALLVAPASPSKFGLDGLLPSRPLPLDSCMVASGSDPWMSLTEARAWAQAWRCRFIDLGDVGHINVEAGFGPLPVADKWVRRLAQRLARQARAARAHPLEFSFSV